MSELKWLLLFSIALFLISSVMRSAGGYRGAQGTRIIGTYDSIIDYGQSRALVARDRLVRFEDLATDAERSQL